MASRPSPDAPQRRWDAWWNRELSKETALLVPPIPEITAVKAEIGSGLFTQGFPMLSSLSNRPEKLIAECEVLFHTNGWIAAVERAITSRIASVQYHLEDDADDTVDDSTPIGASLLRVLEHPSPRRTRRQLWGITARHMGLTGNAFWYLSQRELLGGTPLEVLYINPARMTPVEDSGGDLLGWIMDHPQNPLTPPGMPGTPFDLEEIIHFKLDEPDWGNYGIGIAESAQSKVELSRQTDRHALLTLGSGGRLAGIISPKEGVTISDDGWQAVVRDYRNIQADPDSAKRLQVIRSPMDFTKTAADPTEMQLSDLMTASRDDIFALWGVPLSQQGITSSRGLNSGDIPKFEEAQLWQGPIDARLAPFIEKVQTELIDRWANLGLVVTIEVETPAFDDQAPMFVNASAAVNVPLTHDERRALVGLDPFEDEVFGSEVYIASTLTRVDPNAPEPVAPVIPPPITDQGFGAPEQVQGGIKATALETLRHRVEVTWEPRIRKVIADVLAAQKDEVSGRVFSKHAHLSRKPTDTAVWWNSEHERNRLREALEPLVVTMAREVARRAEEKVPRSMRPSKAVPDAGYIDTVLNALRRKVGVRITGITDTTRDKIGTVLEAGVTQGLGPIELSKLVQDATAFDEARAEMISRTETMFAYNDAALGTYRELGAEMVEAIDGDQDDECAGRDGQPFSLDEAESIQDHPNGTLDWVPIVPEKAEKMSPAVWAGIAEMAKAASVPVEIPAPIVNVAAPEVYVAPPDISPFTTVLERIEAVLTAPKARPVIDRNEQGHIVGIHYE